MMKKVISYDKLPSEVLDELHEQYPDGLDDHLFKVNKGNGESFYAVSCEYEEISYLIKIDIEIDTHSFLDSEEEDKNVPSEINENKDVEIEVSDEDEEEEEYQD